MHAAALVLLMLMIYIAGTRPPPLAGFFSSVQKRFHNRPFPARIVPEAQNIRVHLQAICFNSLRARTQIIKAFGLKKKPSGFREKTVQQKNPKP